MLRGVIPHIQVPIFCLPPQPQEKTAPCRDEETDLTPSGTSRGCVYLDFVKSNRGEVEMLSGYARCAKFPTFLHTFVHLLVDIISTVSPFLPSHV